MPLNKLTYANDVESSTKSEPLFREYLNEDDFVRASTETIYSVVSDLLNRTVNNLSAEDGLLNLSVPRSKGKQKSSCEVSSSDNKDLPVRRSSRIQSKTFVKKDEVVKKKRSLKSDESNLIDVVLVDEENCLATDDFGKDQISIGITDSQTADSKIESVNHVKRNREVGPKPPRTPKRSQKRTDKKEELKSAEKIKTERKRTVSRKRKQEIVDLDDEHNKIKNDDNKAPSNNCYKTIVKEDTVSSSQITRTSLNKTQKTSTTETKVTDTFQSIIKLDDEKNCETSDTSSESSMKPVKVKSRWWRSSELEGVLNTENSPSSVVKTENTLINPSSTSNQVDLEDISVCVSEESKSFENENIEKEMNSSPNDCNIENVSSNESSVLATPELSEQPSYEHIEENIYRFERKKSKSKKQVRRMICDCTLTKEEQECGVLGCKEECLNRLLMIECGYRCPIGEACSNKKFTKKEYVKAEIFKAEKKGWGLRALEPVSAGDFLMEFVGEVLNHKEYRQRVKQYARDKNVHCYFMALKTDEILDATSKGNFTRFINHSCDPNCETQKWTVNGELRIGVFAKRTVSVGEEFTLDYQFQRYGREAQKCYCGSHNCSGYIGENKQITIDAYGSKSSSSKRKKNAEEKKRDWEDMTLEEEIEKLNSNKGLRNREETLKFARLMVRADDNATRHQLLDLILKTEEQACLRLFLDYHGLPLLWSWMTDIVDFGLKSKILQLLQLLPIPNKTMLLDSKVMSIVEKWVQECDIVQKENSVKNTISDISSEAGIEFMTKKIKFPDFSDSETDSSGSQHAAENSEHKIPVDNSSCKTEFSPSDIPLPDTASDNKTDIQCSKLDSSVDTLKKDISSVGSELLCAWKNLKEVFRIPRLEQQKRRKEDEIEADHSVLSRIQTEVKKPDVEVTGNQIQVLISGKTTDNMKSFDYDNPDINYKHDHRSRKTLLKPPSSNKQIRRADEEVQQNINEDSSVDSDSSILASSIANNTIPQHTIRPALLPIPTYLNQPPVNFPPPILPSTAQPPPIKNPPPGIYPSQIIYPQPPQVNFLSTSIPPPTIHPPTNMPPPASIIPKQQTSIIPPSLLQQPPPNIPPPIQPINTSLPPISTSYILPPNVPPISVVPPSQFLPNPAAPVSSYPATPNAFGNQNQSFYYLQQPPAISNAALDGSFSDNVPIQTVPTVPVQSVTASSVQANPLPIPGANPLQPAAVNSFQIPSTNVLPAQSINQLPLQPSMPTQEVMPSPIVEETKPIKLPKNWRTATDSEGNTYYYHSVTRETQWDPPEVNDNEESEDEEEDSVSEESESSDTPTYDEPKISSKHSKRKMKKKKTTKAAADTSVSFPVRPEIAKKIKELFRTKMSTFIVQCLNHYRKPECKVGRITSNEDFKYLARKLTHYIMTKEIKQLKNVEDLDCNETVTHKAKDFIKKYMSKYGSKYNRKEKCSPS